MSAQGLEQPAGRRFPQQDMGIRATTRQKFSIGTEGESIYEIDVAVQDLAEFAKLGVPQHDPRFLAGAREKPAIRAGGDRPDRLLVSQENLA